MNELMVTEGDDELLDLDELPPGKRGLSIGDKVTITIEDCCIRGELSGTFLGWDLETWEATFDFGRLEADGQGWRVKI